jgi:hypothetical protein
MIFGYLADMVANVPSGSPWSDDEQLDVAPAQARP